MKLIDHFRLVLNIYKYNSGAKIVKQFQNIQILYSEVKCKYMKLLFEFFGFWEKFDFLLFVNWVVILTQPQNAQQSDI